MEEDVLATVLRQEPEPPVLVERLHGSGCHVHPPLSGTCSGTPAEKPELTLTCLVVTKGTRRASPHGPKVQANPDEPLARFSQGAVVGGAVPAGEVVTVGGSVVSGGGCVVSGGGWVVSGGVVVVVGGAGQGSPV